MTVGWHLLLLVALSEVGSNVPLELGHEKRSALLAAALVANRVLNLDLVEDSAVVELDKESVGDGALSGIMVVDAVLRLLDTVNLGTERINAGVGGGGISVRLGSQLSVDQRESDHVIDVVARETSTGESYDKPK